MPAAAVDAAAASLLPLPYAFLFRLRALSLSLSLFLHLSYEHLRPLSPHFSFQLHFILIHLMCIKFTVATFMIDLVDYF